MKGWDKALNKLKLKAFGKYAAVFLAAVILTSLLWNLNQILLFRDVSYAEAQDYIVFLERRGNEALLKVKNGTTGHALATAAENFSRILNSLLQKNNLTIFIKPGEYNVSENIMLYNRKNVKILSNNPNATRLNMNGHAIIIKGEQWSNSRNNQIEGLEIYNGSIIIENSFKTIVRNCVFTDSETGITLSNTNGWTECTLIEECYFINVYRGIVFKAPRNEGTRSYANTEMRRVFFELNREGATAIYIEQGADFNEGLLQDVRVWMGKPVERNQTGILLEGSMLNTVLQNVVFESFAHAPTAIYGIRVGNYSDPPILGQGVVFCGNLSGRIYNPHGKWLYSSSGAFKEENVEIPLGTNSKFGETRELGALPHLSLSIISINAKVQVEGNFSDNETVQVRLRFKFIDDTPSDQLILTFNSSETMWVDEDSWLKIWPSRTVISALLVDARTSAPVSNVKIKVSVYGVYG